MITITTPNAEKIYFTGTSIEANNIYCRIGFVALPCGKKMNIPLYFYANEADYNNGMSIVSLIGVEGFDAESKTYDLSNGDGTYKDKTLAVAHDEVKAWLDGLGYLATISGI